ncbi:putative acetyltransferase [compost metagenome]
MVDIKQLSPGEEAGIIPLIRESFDAHISENYSALGIIEFYKYITLKAIQERLNSNHVIFVAHSGNNLVGIVELRDNNHIALLFVKNEAKGTGVGKALFGYVLEKLAKEGVRQLTVNSSPNSVSFYKSQGFLPLAEEEEVQGIRSVRMQLSL